MNSTTTARIAALEDRVTALEERLAPSPDRSGPAPAARGGLPDLPQAIEANDELVDGAVVFGGAVTVGARTVAYQWARPTHWVTDSDWDEQIERLAALAHPVRGQILRHVLCDPSTVAELVEAGVVTSPGTAYHHLNALQAAGWLTKAGGSFTVPPARIVALMTIITAAEAH
ncbi:helix-turn-helix domain-containing protein [Corynebacterium sp.]|uniref:ArsR/SmtB family transcription factor n=1 Tax=Corynebacterium sp. TaxID=1720 RepID=UPI002A90B17C|nr:helix-turn-helix domain-containing protein [Corynebacterium sp.]MDY5784761.1 helix-turn-helix domain-containing protein [Corynebacterium sp.]